MKCHNCAGDIAPPRSQEITQLVSSDCQPQTAELTIGACDACGLVQKEHSEPWRATCARIYANYRIYYQAAGKEQKVRSLVDDTFRPRSEHIARLLADRSNLVEAGNVLDIGCGNGAFLRAFHAAFPRWAIHGAELNATFASDIEAITPGAKFLDIAQLESYRSTFDLVTLIHCLEHIPNPSEYLRNIGRLFDRNTLLLIEVPDAEKNPFDLLIADHASHFSAQSLKRAVELAGFDVIEYGNLLLGKEITLLAKLPDSGGAPNPRLESTPNTWMEINLGWLKKLESEAERMAEVEPIGIFGSSIAGTWLGNALGDRLSFFVDEDPARIGSHHLGVEILSPQAVPANATVLVALEPRLARTIGERLQTRGIRAVSPSLNAV